ncbi:MAG: HAMP domain-containing histidine kinase, partial [Bdellovibrionales bacterium]|nr:HAMP domain-containing histidine kinase [Bdellovibrionales bacterium]
MKLFSHNTARKLFKYQRDSARSERDSARIERDSARSECNVLRQDVARMEKNESLRENFVTTLTHDLRNPVATIKMAIEVLKTDPMGEHFDAIMKLIDQNADQAEELISHLLDANLIKSGIKLPLNKSHCEILSVLK